MDYQRRKNIVRLTLLAVVMCPLGRLSASPEPSPVPVSWELSLAPSPPMRIEVDTGKGPSVYWYMLYTVTNNTSKDVDFQPEIVRVSEIESEVPFDQAAQKSQQAAKITVDPAIVGVHPKVFAAIKKRHAKTHPFLISPVEAITRLRQGRDNAISSVAVFKDLDARVSKFTIYFSGLSGERVVQRNPVYHPPVGNNNASPAAGGSPAGLPKFFVLRKTLAIPYTLPGDIKTRRNAMPSLGRMTWVMR